MSAIINSYFSKNGIPFLGLSPIIRIWEVTETTNTLIINNDSMTEIGDGFYTYNFISANGYDENKRYVIRSDGNNATLSNIERYSVGSTQESSLSNNTINTIVNSTWDEVATNHITSGTTGFLLNKISADTTQLVSDHVLQISLLDLLLKYEKNKTEIDKINATLTIFDDDGITPLTIFDLKDSNGAPSITEICARIPR